MQWFLEWHSQSVESDRISDTVALPLRLLLPSRMAQGRLSDGSNRYCFQPSNAQSNSSIGEAE